jgi:hypothetical protein
MPASSDASTTVTLLGFGDEAIAAVIVFALGVIFTIIWSKVQKDRYRLSYEVKHQHIAVDAPSRVKEKIRLFYGESEVSSLHSFVVVVRNSGNKSVQSQTVRFDFPPDAQLLSEPELEHAPLIGPIELRERTDSPLALTYQIGQMPKGSQTEFRILTCNNRDVLLRVSGRNDSNPDTEFLEKEATKQSTSKDNVSELVLMLFAFLLIGLLPSGLLVWPIKTGLLVGVLLAAMPVTLRVVRDFHDRIFSEMPRPTETNIVARDSARVSYVEKAEQVSISREEP